MNELTGEQFVQTAFELRLLDDLQSKIVWSEVGSQEASLDEVRQAVLRRDLMTNFQIDRMLKGEKSGYFYGPYKVLYLVGVGTFSRVYRGIHVETGRVLAVKVLRRRYSDDKDPTAREFIATFESEAEMGMKLRHPNIVAIHDLGKQRMLSYLARFMAMDFVEGQTLRDFLKIRGQFDPPEAMKLIADVCAGLDYAHQRGITHRDLKLSNVLVSSKGQGKLVDFGLAGADKSRNLTEERIDDVANQRTIDYAGLERATGVRKDDPRSDVYFVGCMLYHLVSGKPPLYETKNRVERLDRNRFLNVVPLSQAAPGVPGVLVHIVQKAMELQPDHRYQSPAEMLTDLKTAAEKLHGGELAEAGADEAAAHLAAAQTRAPGSSGRVMLVESDFKVQDLFRDQLRQFGFRVLVTADPARALVRAEENGDQALCLLFSSRGLGRSAVEAYQKCLSEDSLAATSAVLLLDAKHSAWAQGLSGDGKRAVLTMPVKLKRLEHVLRKLCAAAEAT